MANTSAQHAILGQGDETALGFREFLGQASGNRFGERTFGDDSDEGFPGQIEELLSFLSLAEERGKLVVDYSQGMRKKLALACALVHGPSVLFLDEPLNGIDPVSGRIVSDLLRRLTTRGVTIFFTSHVLSEVDRVCDRVRGVGGLRGSERAWRSGRTCRATRP